MKLSFLKTVDLDRIRAAPRRRILIEDFALERSINMLWGAAGSGKTSFMFAFAKHLCQRGYEVGYIDTDNGLDLLQDRGYDQHIESIGVRFSYVNVDSFDSPREDILRTMEEIRAKATDGFYANCVFIFDSLKFFLQGGIYDESKIDRFVAFSKSIRRNGGTVWILNHATKSGENMKGGQSLVDAVDEVWEMETLPEQESSLGYIFRPQKRRMPVKEASFAVDKKTLSLQALDPQISGMSSQERDFVESVQKTLKQEKIKQKELLARVGKNEADKTALGWLEKHAGRFWSIEREGRNKVYTSLTTLQDGHKTPKK